MSYFNMKLQCVKCKRDFWGSDLGDCISKVESHNCKKGGKMNVNEFANCIAIQEAGKKEVNIAQIKEIVRIINRLLEGQLYKLIRKL